MKQNPVVEEMTKCDKNQISLLSWIMKFNDGGEEGEQEQEKEKNW